MEINRTTTFYIISIGITVIMIFFFSIYNRSIWGGWKPPSLAFSLSPSEIKWKKIIENEYECKIDYVGFEDYSLYEDVKDSSIFIKIKYYDYSILNNQLNDSIEFITSKIGKSFVKHANKKRLKTEKRIFITYTHNQIKSQKILQNNIPEERNCVYDFKKKVILPLSRKLIINKFPFFHFFKKELYFPKLGEKDIIFYKTDSTVETKMNSNYKYKLLDSCVFSEQTKPIKIFAKNLEISYGTDFIYFQNRCIYAKISYQCNPKVNTTNAIDFVRYVTELSPEKIKYSEEDKLKLVDKLKQSNYNFNNKLFDFKVVFKVDSTRIPWTIFYETALDEFKFYKSFE